MGRHSIPGPSKDNGAGDKHPDHLDGPESEPAPEHEEGALPSDDHAVDDHAADDHAADDHAAGEHEDYADDYTDEYSDDYVDEYVEPAPLTGPPPHPPPPPSGTDWQGGHRNEGEWTGSHRTLVQKRRGVSLGVIAALVTVVVVVAGVILWRFFGDALSSRSDAAAGRCLDGESKVAVVADPTIADYLGKFAKSFNETAKPVGDHCVSIVVKPADADAVVAGLLGTWPAELGDKPALWIPGSSVSVARLQAGVDAKTISASRSLVTSPVLIATRPELKTALAQQNWATLPALQTDPAALDGLNLAGWGSLRLALPATGDSEASYLAAEAVAAATAPAGAPATAGTGAVSSLVAGQPKLANTSADEAIDTLLKSDDPASAPVHAVVTTEQQLFQRAASIPDAKNTLASWLPPGPAAVADFPAVLFGGDWISEEQASAASEYERYLRKPEQLAELAKAGFRADGTKPPTSDVVDFAALPATLSVGDDTVRTTLANVLTAPATGAATSIMLDRSLNLTPVVNALTARITALAPNAAVALTTFDSHEGTSQVTLGPLSDDVDGRTRGDTLKSTLDGLSPAAGGGVSFTTLRNVYGDALTGFRPGQTNSVLVITTGPHTDQSLDSTGLQDMVRQNADPARPVAINVINVGPDPDGPTWQSVAQISGGTYQNVPASDSPELVAAVNTMLN
jgi:hypothetical protein